METLFLELLHLSVLCGVGILFIFAVSPLLQKRCTVFWRYCLWVLLAVRLILPFDFSISGQAVVIFSVPDVFLEEESSVVLPKSRQMEGEKREKKNPSENYLGQQNRKPVAENEKIEYVPQTEAAGGQKTDVFDLVIWWAKIVWAAVAAALFIWQSACCAFYFSKVNRTKHFYGQKEKLMVYRSSVVCSPMLIGIRKPQILLPDREYTKEELAFILEHEYTHYKRKDIWVRLLFALVKTIHWFNPLVLCMERQAIQDMELLCDSSVVKSFSKEEKKRYSMTLLHCASSEKNKGAVLCTSEFSKDVSALKERFANIFSGGRKKKGIYAALFGIVFVVSVSLFVTGRVSKKEAENISKEPEIKIEEKCSMLLSLSEEEAAGAVYGASFPKMAYASEKRAILYDYWGLLIYNFNERKIEQLLNLKSLDANHMQGEKAAHIEVSADGEQILLYNESDQKERFIYDIENKKLSYTKIDSFTENAYDKIMESGGKTYAFTDTGKRVFLTADSLWTKEGENYHTKDMQGLSLIVADNSWGGGEIYPLFWDYFDGYENQVEPRMKQDDLCRIVGKVCLYEDKEGWSYYLEEDTQKESALWEIASVFEPLLLTRYKEGERQVLEDLIFQEAWMTCPVLFVGGRIVYKAAKTEDIMGLKDPALVSISMDGSDRKTADTILYNVFDGICEDGGFIYYSGWTNDVFPKPLCRISPDFSSEAQFVENIWGYLCGVKDGEVYYVASQEKQREGIYKKNLATGEEKVSDKLGITAEALTFFRVREELFLKGELYDRQCDGFQILYSYDEYENINCIKEPF